MCLRTCFWYDTIVSVTAVVSEARRLTQELHTHIHTHRMTRMTRVGLRGYLQLNKHAHTHTQTKAQGVHGLNNNCRESVSTLSRLIRDVRNKYDLSPLGRINVSSIE